MRHPRVPFFESLAFWPWEAHPDPVEWDRRKLATFWDRDRFGWHPRYETPPAGRFRVRYLNGAMALNDAGGDWIRWKRLTRKERIALFIGKPIWWQRFRDRPGDI